MYKKAFQTANKRVRDELNSRNKALMHIRMGYRLTYVDLWAMPETLLDRLSSFHALSGDKSALYFVDDYTPPFTGQLTDFFTPVLSSVPASNVAYIARSRNVRLIADTDIEGDNLSTVYYNLDHISCFTEQGHRLNLIYAPPPSNVPSTHSNDSDTPFYRQLHIPNTVSTLDLLRDSRVLGVPNTMYHNLIETFERGLVLPNRPTDYLDLPQGIPAIG